MPIDNNTQELSFDSSVKVADSGKPILGRLKGICADFLRNTRNGRKYSESLWDKVFNSPLIKEQFDCGGIFGELDHPEDRDEVCSEKIAICMPKPPEKDKSGHLVGIFDILDTPCGRIAYTLAEYGYKLGISSRGNGDVYTDANGEECVDEDTYQLNAFDLVLLPSVKEARLQLVNESLNNKKTFKQAINEALEKSGKDDRKVMQDILDDLKIDYKNNPQLTEVDNIDADQKDDEADDNGSDVIDDLQEALEQKSKLEQKVIELNEKLSVCYAKEINQKAMVDKYTKCIATLSDEAKKVKVLESKVSKLQEDLDLKSNQLNEQIEKNSKLSEANSRITHNTRKLDESINDRETKINSLNSKVIELKKSLRQQHADNEQQVNQLKESIQNLKTNSQIKNSEYTTKLEKATKLAEQYKATAKAAVNRYIDLQAKYLGVNSSDITCRLSENYSFNDIDNVCNDLKNYQLSLNTLPFNVGSKKIKMNIKESVEKNKPANNSADVVDSQLLKLAGIE